MDKKDFFIALINFSKCARLYYGEGTENKVWEMCKEIFPADDMNELITTLLVNDSILPSLQLVSWESHQHFFKNRVNAIKLIRDSADLDLRTAKDMVFDVYEKNESVCITLNKDAEKFKIISTLNAYGLTSV